MSIRAKLVLALFLMVGIILGVNLIYRSLSSSFEHEILQLSQGALVETIYATKMRNTLLVSQLTLHDLVEEYLLLKLASDPEAKSKAKNAIIHYQSLMRDSLTQLKGYLTSSQTASQIQVNLAERFDDKAAKTGEAEETEWFQRLEKLIERYRELTQELIETAKTSPERALKILDDEIETFFRNELLTIVEKFQADTQKELDEKIASITAHNSHSRRVILLALVFSVSAAVFLSYYLSRIISIPLKKLSDNVKNIPKGEFQPITTLNSKNEFAHLAAAMADMADTIRGQTVELQGAKDELANQNAILLRRVAEQTHQLIEKKEVLEQEISERRNAQKRRKKLEAQLRQAQKMEAIGTFAGGIAHDFNNILSAIVGYTELALAKTSKDTPLHDDLQEVFRAGLRACGLVKQILTFSRRTEQELQPVQVNLIVKEALKFLRSSLPSNIEIRRNITSDARVLADPTQIHQVLMNLCANAKHAMQRTGGLLEVLLTEMQLDADSMVGHPGAMTGKYLKLTVADSGVGMPAEVLEKIFEPFFTTKSKDEGTGMGLSVVHGIVKSSGGIITVYSEPGQGTTFNVFWPVVEVRDRPQEEVKGPQPTGSERVLFVDDEMPLAEIGKQMLEGYGYRVSLCTSGVEALELFKANPVQFDLVITDMTMPNMSGLDLASEIISLRPEMRIILCTGFSEKITPAGAEAAGIKAFMLKPVSQDDLIHTVREVLDAPK